jgi:beta-lactamase regulating signal transducer with metallopeptidase domain
MLAWMLYVIMVTLLLSIGAYAAERAARLRRARTRWIWATAIVASLALPTIVSSVSIELPSVVAPPVAQKMVALRDATTQVLSPVMWVSGSAAEPRGWRDFDSLLTALWRAASAAMLAGLLVSGLVLFVRKRRWRMATVSGAQVHVTEGVGPAVVGLLRPRIVVPTWVTLALPRVQSAVIAHEQSHLDARDPQLLTVALALLVFMPWNLPLWWQLRRLRYAIEVDCDARVLRGGIDPTHYGETLISVGERQSAYIGAVAAMSESKSFLEQRIRIMISKPVRWRRAGMAALAATALAVTALAAQVSPPNVHAVDEPAAASAPAGDHRAERVAIKLPAATLDGYVGSYRLSDQIFLELKREGDKMMAQLTGQPWFELFAESDGHFFWKIVDAQLDLANDGTGSGVLHQNGRDLPLTRVSGGEAQQAKAALDQRIATKTAAPGTEAALRHHLDSTAAGHIDYDRMEPALEDAYRRQEAQAVALRDQLGAVQSIHFAGVGKMGWDIYDVTFAKGTLQYRIILSDSGKMAGLMATSLP